VTEGLRDFLQSLQENVKIVPELRQDCFLWKPFEFFFSIHLTADATIPENKPAQGFAKLTPHFNPHPANVENTVSS